MNNLAINKVIGVNNGTRRVPATPRGRALHTVDWFMNGKPVLNNHDNSNIKLEHLRG